MVNLHLQELLIVHKWYIFFVCSALQKGCGKINIAILLHASDSFAQPGCKARQILQWCKWEAIQWSGCHCADWVHKACMLIRASIIQQICLFSIQSIFFSFPNAVAGGLSGKKGQASTTSHHVHRNKYIHVQKPDDPRLNSCVQTRAASSWILHQRCCRVRWCGLWNWPGHSDWEKKRGKDKDGSGSHELGYCLKYLCHPKDEEKKKIKKVRQNETVHRSVSPVNSAWLEALLWFRCGPLTNEAQLMGALQAPHSKQKQIFTQLC